MTGQQKANFDLAYSIRKDQGCMPLCLSGVNEAEIATESGYFAFFPIQHIGEREFKVGEWVWHNAGQGRYYSMLPEFQAVCQELWGDLQ